MSLPTRLVTNIKWIAAEEENEQRPEVEKPILLYDSGTEEPEYIKEEDEEELRLGRKREKRPRLFVSGVPSTPGADEEDDDVSVGVQQPQQQLWPFDQVYKKLDIAAWEIRQLKEVLAMKNIKAVRVQRHPLSRQEKADLLELGIEKRNDGFANAEQIFKKGVENLEKEIRNQREYLEKLSRINKQWRIVAPEHGLAIMSTLKPEEPLAINLEASVEDSTVDDLILINRTNSNSEDTPFTSLKETVEGGVSGPFEPHAILAQLLTRSYPPKVLGQASTLLKNNVDLGHMPRIGGMDVDEEGFLFDLNKIEARFRDARARSLMRKLSTGSELKLGPDHILQFQLVPEKLYTIINYHDGICSLALNLLERGKPASIIQSVCLQKLMFPVYFQEMSKVCGASSITWKHDDDDDDTPEKVQSRCQIDVGCSGKYTVEFVLMNGAFTFDWSTVPDYRPILARPLSPIEAVKIASDVSVLAIVKDMVAMVDSDATAAKNIKSDSFVVEHKQSAQKLLEVKVSHSDGNMSVKILVFDEQEWRDISNKPFIKLRLNLANCLKRLRR